MRSAWHHDDTAHLTHDDCRVGRLEVCPVDVAAVCLVGVVRRCWFEPFVIVADTVVVAVDVFGRYQVSWNGVEASFYEWESPASLALMVNIFTESYVPLTHSPWLKLPMKFVNICLNSSPIFCSSSAHSTTSLFSLINFGGDENFPHLKFK